MEHLICVEVEHVETGHFNMCTARIELLQPQTQQHMRHLLSLWFVARSIEQCNTNLVDLGLSMAMAMGVHHHGQTDLYPFVGLSMVGSSTIGQWELRRG